MRRPIMWLFSAGLTLVLVSGCSDDSAATPKGNPVPEAPKAAAPSKGLKDTNRVSDVP